MLAVLVLAAAAVALAPARCGNTTTFCPNSAGCCAAQYSPTKYGCQLDGAASSCCKPGPPDPPIHGGKNCLIIGDSVSIGYFSYSKVLVEELSGICQVQHGPWDVSDGGAGATSNGVACLDNWLVTQQQQPVQWDAIHFNFGLHNLDNSTAAEALYLEQLANITTRLQATGAKLQYALTTPFMPLRTVNNTCVEDMNTMATKLMGERDIPLVDLYSVVTAHCGGVYTDCDWCRMHPCSYHYGPEGMDAQGKAVADALKKLLLSEG